MQAERVHRGFHRIGIVLSALMILLLTAIAFLLLSADTGGGRIIRENIGVSVVVYVVLVIGPYALCRGLGWIVAGFVAE